MYIINLISDRTNVNEKCICMLYTQEKDESDEVIHVRNRVYSDCVQISKIVYTKIKVFLSVEHTRTKHIRQFFIVLYQSLKTAHYGQQWKWWSLCGRKNYTKTNKQKGKPIRIKSIRRADQFDGIADAIVYVFRMTSSFNRYTLSALSPSLFNRMFFDPKLLYSSGFR